MAGLVKEIGDQEFKKEVLESSLPTLVDFWAPWCGPCKAIAPVVEELAQSFQGKVQFVKMNVDDHQSTPSTYGIRGIPTLLLFKNGQILDQIVGNAPKRDLQKLIEKAI